MLRGEAAPSALTLTDRENLPSLTALPGQQARSRNQRARHETHHRHREPGYVRVIHRSPDIHADPGNPDDEVIDLHADSTSIAFSIALSCSAISASTTSAITTRRPSADSIPSRIASSRLFESGET